MDQIDAGARLRDLELMEARDQEAAEEERKNRDFTQVYAPGWKRIIELADQSPAAVKLYALLAGQMDERAGAIVVSQHLLAELIGVTERTVRRLTASLEEIGAIARIKVGIGIYAYAINPAEVWKSWSTSKRYSAFVTRTLVDPRSAARGAVKLRQMVGSDPRQPQLEGLEPPAGTA